MLGLRPIDIDEAVSAENRLKVQKREKELDILIRKIQENLESGEQFETSEEEMNKE